MEEKTYKVLWIDDEHESLMALKGRAKRNGIVLDAYKSLEGGMAVLEKNSTVYDGVLLDAKFFKEEQDQSGTEDTDNVHRAKERILGLQKKFEIFVLTGQAEAFEDKTFSKAFKNVFKKGDNESIEALFKAIKTAAEAQEDTQIKHLYSPVFNTIKKGSFLAQHESSLIEMLKDIDSGTAYNFMRKVLESLFLQLSTLSIIPQDFLEERGWINGTSLFLSGKHHSYVFQTQIIHPAMAELLFRVLNIVQDASHREGNLSLRIEEFLKLQPTGYLYKSTVYAFLELLVYFNAFIAQNQDVNDNRRRWVKKEIVEDWRIGHLVSIAENGWGLFVCYDNEKRTEISVPPAIIANNQLTENMELKVRIEPSPDKTKLFIKEVK